MEHPEWVYWLPTVNATLNGLAGLQLAIGLVLIKRGRIIAHRNVMLAAFGTSVLFLTSYLIYHSFEVTKKFGQTGPVAYCYYAVLITHIILAAAVPFLALVTIYRAWRQQWEKHRRIAKVTFPIWMYVSVTGIIIYLMLYHYP